MNIKFAKWNAIDGKFTWYDKENKVEKDFEFDQFPVVRVGFNYSGFYNGKGCWSNEVTNITNEEFVVCNSDGCINRGLYSEMNIQGCEINIVVYGLINEEVIAIMLKGTGYHSLTRTLSSIDIIDNCLRFDGKITGEKDGNFFFIPKFSGGDDINDDFKFNIDVDIADTKKLLEEHYASNREKYKDKKPKPIIKEEDDEDIDADLAF